MIVALELQGFGPAGMRTGQPKCQHRGFAAGVGQPYYFSGRNHPSESLRRLHFGGSCSREMRAFRHGLGYDLNSLGCACPWMSAPNDIMKSTYSLPSASHTCELWPRSRKTGPGEHGSAARRRVDAFNQRLLGSLEQLL
jgi:hypothetical protein